jgi:hypothetical protein
VDTLGNTWGVTIAISSIDIYIQSWYLVMTIFSIGTYRDKFSKIDIY